MPHISITLYKGRDRETINDIANTLRDSLQDTWNAEALSVSVKEVEPDEFNSYVHKKLHDEDLVLTSDYIK